MKINSINSNNQNQTTFQKGLYFTKTSTVLFDKSAKLKTIAKKAVSTSEDGFRYVENTTISNTIKDRIAKVPFVKDLAEKFDTFVYMKEPFKSPYYDKAYSPLKIKWFDTTTNSVKRCDVLGKDNYSRKQAVNDMLKNLEDGNFF